MSKFDVGVGEEFPVDENSQAAEEGGCRGRHGAHRGGWRRFKHQMHAEWHSRRKAWRHGRCHHDGAEAGSAIHEQHLHHLVLGGLVLIGVAAVLSSLRRQG